MKNEGNNKLWKLRHSAEHVLMQAMRELGYKFHMAMGPATDDGFYFDFELLEKNISEADFSKIEKKMREIVQRDLPFTKQEVSEQTAREMFKDNPYKQEWIDTAVAKKDKITIYFTGEPSQTESFVDLCTGPHVNSTKEIGHFKLLSIAGAYWRGDEKNIMLTRIYGTAFPTQKELEEYLNMLEEAKKRDHRRLGKELGIYTTSEEVGQGLILWMPKGVVIRDQLENWARETEKKWGYQRVSTPHIAKSELYKISGHLPYYSEDLYSPLDIEGEEYYLKPMNCPHHHMIYKGRIRSYKEMPVRLTEYAQVYRYEKSGTLHGLMRVRGFCQNDAHIYVQPEKAVEEFISVLEMHKYYYEKLGIKSWWIVLGIRDKENLRKKYHGDDKIWEESETLTKQALEKASIEYVIDEGGAAHYGPKGDIFIKSVIGKEYAIGTIQLDLYMAPRFGLKYIDKDGSEKIPYIIHRAPLGSHERMVGFLLEHFAGAFPTWIAPEQVRVIPISQHQNEYAQEVHNKLIENEIRAESDLENETMQNKIRKAQELKIPYMIVVGGKEEENKTISVRLRTGKTQDNVRLDEFAKLVKEKIKNKSMEL